jgi:hypothetical protein
MAHSTAGKAGGYVTSPRTAMWPGKIATPRKSSFPDHRTTPHLLLESQS